MPDIYCGDHNCYDVLGVDRSSSALEVRRAYRQMSLQYHPDKNKEEGAEAKFQQIVAAYEVLRDEESRSNYDYMLDHPEEYYRNMYNYYRHQHPRVDPTVIIVVTISVISAVQYFIWWNNHRYYKESILADQRMRHKAKGAAVDEGHFENERQRLGRKLSKAEEDAIIEKVLLDNVELKGAYGPPSLFDVLWARILLSPYTLCVYVGWYVYWIYRIRVRGEKYKHDDLVWLICRNLGCSLARFESFDDSLKESLFDGETWIRENAVAFQKREEEEVRQKYAGRFKQMKRMKKKGAASFNYND